MAGYATPGNAVRSKNAMYVHGIQLDCQQLGCCRSALGTGRYSLTAGWHSAPVHACHEARRGAKCWSTINLVISFADTTESVHRGRMHDVLPRPVAIGRPNAGPGWHLCCFGYRLATVKNRTCHFERG